MRKVNHRLRTVISLVIIESCLLSAQAAAGQNNDRLVLIVESKFRLDPVTPGQAGWDTKDKGGAYLDAQPDGRFAGSGEWCKLRAEGWSDRCDR
jgi:hypothetical protein